MDQPVKIYTEEEILALVSSLEKNENSFKWLMEHCIELAAVADALTFGKKTAEKWLETNGYIVLSQFIAALDYDVEQSFQFLVHYEQKEWAAVISFVNDDDDGAMLWLFKSHLKYFAALAGALKERRKRMEKTGIGGIGGIGGGDLGGGSGFGGFGGGSFGGGGASDGW